MAGVGVGTGAFFSVLGKLATLLSKEYTLLKRVRKDIEFLQRELGAMEALVNRLADTEELNEVEKDWKGRMRDLSYDMEECIDRFMLRLDNGNAKPSWAKKTARCVKTLFLRHEIGSEIKELMARVKEERERQHMLPPVASPEKHVKIDPRIAAFHGVAKDLVAMDGRREEVISLLKEESLKLKVVYIVGGGGLGKTTLAMEAYRKIERGVDFGRQAHVSVSRTPDNKKLLKDVLSQIDQDAFSRCERWEEDQLIREIQRALKGNRYFLVIDDVWTKRDWDYVKAAFPDDNNASRIIVTTRNGNVCQSSCSSSGDQCYRMLPLNEVHSRELFLKRISLQSCKHAQRLEEVLACIFRKCGGLPLAIITIASLLANKLDNKPPNLDQWEALEASIGTGLSYNSDDREKGMRDILLLSYWDLPHHLKTCLLYLCIYPEDWHISCEELKWKWIAERFIATEKGNLYLEAESCLNELVNRSLIQLVDVNVDDDGLKKYCQVHDMVLDLIISLSDEDNFATIVNGKPLPSRKIRRLSLQSRGLELKSAIHDITRSKLHVRSLHVFVKTEEILPLMDFQSLRVFDTCVGQWEWKKEHIRNIGSFYQLRYLSIHGRNIEELPGDIGKLQNLETLDLRGTSILKLPSTIAQLTKLVRLFIEPDRKAEFSADMFGCMPALEEVSHINNVDNPEKFLEELAHLIKLRKISMGCLWNHNEDQSSIRSYRERLASSLNELCNEHSLRYLQSEDVGECLFSDGRTFEHLQGLTLKRSWMERVPTGMASLTNILKLEIKVDLFDKEGLKILMGMPHLTYLQVAVDKSGVITVSSEGFKNLEVFHYATPSGVIKFATGAMPALRRFHLWCAFYRFGNDDDNFDMCIEHLSSLAHLKLTSECDARSRRHVEALEDSVRKAAALHPNRDTLTLSVHRNYDGRFDRW